MSVVCVCLLFSSSRETARKKLNHISISSWFRLFIPVRYCCLTPLLEYIPWVLRPPDNLTDLLLSVSYLPSLIWRVETVNQVCLHNWRHKPMRKGLRTYNWKSEEQKLELISVVSNFSEATFVTEKGAEIHVEIRRSSKIFGSHGFNCRAIGQDLRKSKVRPKFFCVF